MRIKQLRGCERTKSEKTRVMLKLNTAKTNKTEKKVTG